VHLKPRNPLRQRLLHPKDKTPKHKLRSVQTSIGETEQQLHKNMVQESHLSAPDSAVHLHLKEKGL